MNTNALDSTTSARVESLVGALLGAAVAWYLIAVVGVLVTFRLFIGLLRESMALGMALGGALLVCSIMALAVGSSFRAARATILEAMRRETPPKRDALEAVDGALLGPFRFMGVLFLIISGLSLAMTIRAGLT